MAGLPRFQKLRFSSQAPVLRAALWKLLLGYLRLGKDMSTMRHDASLTELWLKLFEAL